MSGVPVEPVYGDDLFPANILTHGEFTLYVQVTSMDDENVCRVWDSRRYKFKVQRTSTKWRNWTINCFDMPTLMGRDSDSEWSLGEVGRAESQ